MAHTRESHSSDIPTIGHVEKVARKLKKQLDSRGGRRIIRTPTLYSRVLSDHVDGYLKDPSAPIQIFVKHENMQLTASYKERGALNKLLELKDRHGAALKDVVAASAGNHAQGVACHARHLGITAHIYMPNDTPTLKVSRTEQHDAKVVQFGGTFQECKQKAVAKAREMGWEFVDPYDDFDIIVGQGTVALEMLKDVEDLDTLVIPVGGGGLVSGMAVVAKAMRPEIVIIGVEAKLFPPYYNARCGITDEIKGGATIAEGIAVKEPGKLNNRIVNGRTAAGTPYVDYLVLAEEEWMEEAIGKLVELEKTVVEGAGAAGLAALLQYASDPEIAPHLKGKKVGIVLSGGNIDTRLLSNILVRDLLIENRMTRMSVVLKDQPGELVKVLNILSAGINVIDIAQDRQFNRLPAKAVAAQIDCEAADKAAFDKAITTLRKKGFVADLISSREFEREYGKASPPAALRE
ncbi:MAG TPA: pyridoxal-phosphate dependent enzyme [Allosphingosinicella sp.]|jgi:threonine dehydratase